MERVNLAVVGGGRIADLNIKGYLGHPRCSLKAVCDLNADTARQRAEQWNAESWCTGYRELLQNPEINAVEILTPHHLHHSMVLEAARAGKHVSVQKPMCFTLEEADQMITACREAGVKLKLFENFVFYPPYRKAKEIIAAGGIGEPLSINIYLGSGLGGWWVPLKTWLWRLDSTQCGGGPSVFDDGFHKLSIARYFFGEIESVRAWVDFTMGVIDSPALITWRFKESARLGVWEVSLSPGIVYQSDYYAADERVEIAGTEGYLWITRCTGRFSEIPPLYHYRDGRTTAYDDLRDDWADSFVDSGVDFIDSILEDREPVLSGEDGRELMRFWLAIERSYKENREVRLEEVGR